jgi:REP element-mobilizing transposase RayT
MQMFRKQSDFEAFERVMVEAHQRQPIRILSYCVLSNHWHFVVWPAADGQVTDFFRRLAHTHAVRWRVSHRYGGDEWVRQTVKDLGLEHTVRPEGRPRKASQSATDSTK